jgi:hypothetical protein
MQSTIDILDRCYDLAELLSRVFPETLHGEWETVPVQERETL